MQKDSEKHPANVIGGPFDGMFMWPPSEADIASAELAETGRFHWYRWKADRQRWVYACADDVVVKDDA
jgi:hypothetical protein